MRWFFDALFGNNKRHGVLGEMFFKIKKKLLLVTFSKIMKLRDKWWKWNDDFFVYFLFRNNATEITFSKIMKKKSFMESFINDNERKIVMLLSMPIKKV